MPKPAWMPIAAVAACLALSTFAAAGASAQGRAPTTTAAAPRSTAIHAVEGVSSTVFQQEQSSFSGLGLRMRIVPPQLASGFSIAPAIEYWRIRSKLRSFDVETTRKDATLAAFFRYDWTREGMAPYAGAGIGMHFLSDEVESPTLDESDSLIKGGFAWLAGVQFPLGGRFGNLIELEHHYMPGQSQLKINWGLSYDLRAGS